MHGWLSTASSLLLIPKLSYIPARMNRILTSLKHEMTCKTKRTPIKIVQVLLLLHVQAWVIYNTIYQRPAYNYSQRSLKKALCGYFSYISWWPLSSGQKMYWSE